MVIGGGMLANAFSAYDKIDDVVVLAAGVSNSGETRREAFGRELRLAEKTITGLGSRLLVYFSTCSIFDPEALATPYVQHKLNIETIVCEMVENYTVFRLPQVAGRTSNCTTLTNYLYHNIIKQQRIDIWDRAYRSIIDVDDVVRIVSHAVDNGMFRNRVVNVASRPSLVTDIVRILEVITGKEAVCTHRVKGFRYEIDTSDISQILKELKIDFGPDYLFRVLSKYYGPVQQK